MRRRIASNSSCGGGSSDAGRGGGGAGGGSGSVSTARGWLRRRLLDDRLGAHPGRLEVVLVGGGRTRLGELAAELVRAVVGQAAGASGFRRRRWTTAPTAATAAATRPSFAIHFTSGTLS